MAQESSSRQGIGLYRSSSAHHQRSPAAGPQKLLRTVSQRLRSLIATTDNGNKDGKQQQHHGSKLFFRREHLGECRCRVTPEEQAEGELGKISKPAAWFLKFSVSRDLGRDYSQKLQEIQQRKKSEPEEQALDEEERRESRVGCFGKKLRSCSMREKPDDCPNCFQSPNSASNSGEDGLRKDEESAIALPDDILEMCLARVPFDSLVRSRAVCKKWRSITLTPHFLQLRQNLCGAQLKPWLFLFGLSRDGVCMGQIQALDPTLDKWHTIRADILAGRLLYSTAAIGSRIYIVGGCSARMNSGNKGGFLKTHKSVLVLDALTGQWSKASAMRAARTTPVVGVFEIKEQQKGNSSKIGSGSSSNGTIHRSRSARHREIGVYRGYSSSSRQSRLMEMMGRRCIQRGIGSCSDQNGGNRDDLWESAYRELGTTRSCSSSIDQSTSNKNNNTKSKKSYGLIVVGGQGEWNETLCSGEVYDPVCDAWKEIAPWPSEMGILCAGVVCQQVFYGYSDSDKLVAYDFDRDSWRGVSISYVPARLQDYVPKLVVCCGRLVLVGVAWASRHNGEQAKAARKLWSLENSAAAAAAGGDELRWVEMSQHPDAPLDWSAVFVGHGDRIYAVEMFKIFGQVLDFVTVCDVGSSSNKDGLAVGRPKWDRVSKRRMGHDMDASSCLTKTAVVVQL